MKARRLIVPAVLSVLVVGGPVVDLAACGESPDGPTGQVDSPPAIDAELDTALPDAVADAASDSTSIADAEPDALLVDAAVPADVPPDTPA